jgi:DNA-binding transcriptional MerR regulator
VDSRLYSIRDIARELGLPESTVRYYRDAFSAYLPSVGSGRRRRYPAEAVPLFRLVAEGYAQNRPRTEIERALQDATGGLPAGNPPPALALRGYGWEGRRDEVLAAVLEGERERREVMWQMARELVRLGEAVERQHVLLTKLTDQLGAGVRPVAAGPAVSPVSGEAELLAPGWGDRNVAATSQEASPDSAAEATEETARELAALREELVRERELVERLRRSKLEIERRAAEAEARLERVQRGAGGMGRSSVFGRLFWRGEEHD